MHRKHSSDSSVAVLSGRGHAVTRIAYLRYPERIMTTDGTGDVLIHALPTQPSNFPSAPSVFSAHRRTTGGIAALSSNLVASGDVSGVLHLWRPDTRIILSSHSFVNPISAITCVDDRTLAVATASNSDEGLAFCRHVRGRGLRVAPVKMSGSIGDAMRFFTCLAAYGSRVVAGSRHFTAQVFGVDGRRLAVLAGHNGCVTAVAMGRRAIAAGTSECSIFLYDAESFGLLRKLESHVASIAGLLLLAEMFILSVSPDLTMALAETADGVLKDVWQLLRPAYAAVVTDDGLICVAGWAGETLVLELPTEVRAVVRSQRDAMFSNHARKAIRLAELGVPPQLSALR